MDRVQRNARAFRHLLNYEYKIMINNDYPEEFDNYPNPLSFRLQFKKKNFAHLCGLSRNQIFLPRYVTTHYSANNVYQDALQGRITEQDMINTNQYLGTFYEQKVRYMDKIEMLLDSGCIMFSWDKTIVNSVIDADAYLYTISNNKEFYIYLQEVRQENLIVCSFIIDPHDNRNRTQHEMDLIYMSKIHKKSGNEQIIINHM